MKSKYSYLISLLEIPNKEIMELVRINCLSEMKRLSKLNDFDKSELFESCISVVKDKIYYYAKYAGLTPHDFS